MNIDKILAEQEKFNKNNKFSTINKETGHFIHLLIKMKRPKNVLEIGTSIGYSSIWIASALSKKSRLTTIERWHERAEIAKLFFKKAKLKIKLIEGNALDVIPKLTSKFNAVFIDATKNEYLKYVLLLIKTNKLKTNALIIADNTISHAAKMQDFLNFAEKKKAITAEIGKGITFFRI